MPSLPRKPRWRRPATADSGAAKPVIWTVSVTRLARLLSDVTPEFDAQAQITPINLGFEEAAREIARRLQFEPCDAIIAAGSNGAYLKARVPRPVVLLRASGFDLMQALARARKISDRIAIITHATDLPEFAEFQQGFGLAIEQRSFLTAEDARDNVAQLASSGTRVIVGTGLATELAEQAGMTGILLYSADTVRSAFESALDLARAARGTPYPFASRGSLRAAAVRGTAVDSSEALLGESAAMQAVREQIRRYAATDTTVLISGETGTGKELAARALHAQSARHAAAFIAVNCGALAESLLESELFGHEEGAFTGSRRGGRVGLIESAQGGTLFLDEIGEMPLPLQSRLLRVLEEREVLRLGSSHPVPVDLRIIAATNREVAELVRSGRFRRDLYYRLDILRIRLPSLRERPQDIPALAQRFLQRSPAAARPLAREARALLARHDWPGNVRELRNLMERVAAHADAGSGTALDAAELKRWAPELDPQADPMSAEMPPPVAARRRYTDAELRAALIRAGGRRALAARMLGVSRTTLWRRLDPAD